MAGLRQLDEEFVWVGKGVGSGAAVGAFRPQLVQNQCQAPVPIRLNLGVSECVAIGCLFQQRFSRSQDTSAAGHQRGLDDVIPSDLQEFNKNRQS